MILSETVLPWNVIPLLLSDKINLNKRNIKKRYEKNSRSFKKLSRISFRKIFHSVLY